MPRRFDAAIFDMDGTIVHTEQFHRRSWELSLAALGRDLDGLDYEATFSGRRGIEIWRDVFGLEPDEAARMVDDLAKHFWDLAGGNLAPIQGLIAFLDRITDLPKALATSAIPFSAVRTLDEMGLRDAFDVVVTAHDITRGKPDPEIFLVAAERLGVAPDRCIAFEDAPSGIAAARVAGMFCVGITTSRDAIAGADLLIAGYDDRRLLDLLSDLDLPSVR